MAGNFKNISGPSEEELVGLNVEDSNKRRRGPDNNIFMEIEGINDETILEAGLSKIDCPGSNTTDLATLARQDSHLQ